MTKENHKSLGKKLAEILSQRGWSQKLLSQKTGLSNAAVSRVISGKRSPNLKTLFALAAGLETTIVELTQGTDHHIYFENTSTSFPASQERRREPESEEQTKTLEQSLAKERNRVAELGAELNETKVALKDALEQATRSKAARDRSLRFANEYFQVYKSALAHIAQVREELGSLKGEPLDAEHLIRRLASLEEKSA